MVRGGGGEPQQTTPNKTFCSSHVEPCSTQIHPKGFPTGKAGNAASKDAMGCEYDKQNTREQGKQVEFTLP